MDRWFDLLVVVLLVVLALGSWTAARRGGPPFMFPKPP
jgi:hypothetical protein